MTTRTRYLVLALTTPLVVFTLVGGLLGQQRTAPGAYPHLRVFDDVVSLIFGSYVEEPNADTVLDGAMLGLAEGLDPDSSWLDAAQVKANRTEPQFIKRARNWLNEGCWQEAGVKPRPALPEWNYEVCRSRGHATLHLSRRPCDQEHELSRARAQQAEA